MFSNSTCLYLSLLEVLKYSNVVVSLNGHCRMSEYLFYLNLIYRLFLQTFISLLH